MDFQALSQLPDDALVRRDVAAQVSGGVSVKTLDRWAAAGKFPAPIKVGAVVLVRLSDLRDWLRDPQGYADRQREEPLA